MPIHTEIPAPQDGGIRSYWLQVLQAGHWRNLEQAADAAAAMIRTGTLAQDVGYDAVRLLEARFHPHRGQTAFHEIVTFDRTGAHFATGSEQTGADHIRMDLSGTIAPLLPSTSAPEVRSAPREAAFAAPPLAEIRDSRDSRATAVPERKMPPVSASRTTAPVARQRAGSTRARLLAGVMAGAFVAGVTISAMSPERSGDIAAAIYEKVGLRMHGAQMRTSTVAAAPTQTGADEAWPAAWGVVDETASTAPTPTASVTVQAAQPDASRPAARTAFSARSGKDLEAENRLPAGNMLAAALAAPKMPEPAAAAPAPAPAPMTEAQAHAMQASLPQPMFGYTPPATEEAAGAVQLAVKDQAGLRLAETGRGSDQGSSFTTAVAGDAAQLGALQEWPRSPRRPATLGEGAKRNSALAAAIEHGSVNDLLTLISGPIRTVSVASLSDGAADHTDGAGRPDLTPLLDFALLQGRPDHAEALAGLGARPSDRILDVLTRSADKATLARIAPIARKVGIDPDRMTDTGMTFLMQAAHAGDARRVEALLTLGADPAFETAGGLRAADFAARAQHTAVQETLVLATDQALYTPIMFGLTWSDTLETVRDRSDVCKKVGEGFVACSLKAQPWLDDTAAIIAQFDTRNGNRLVAIQVDSHLYDDPDAAEVGFKKAAQLVAKVLPPDQFGFPVRDIPPDAGMFHSLTPSVGAGQYFQYWPDDNLRRPVYVHMKMIGYKQNRGFHRIVIGNPFRVG